MEDRKVDKLAGKDSLADKIRKQREAKRRELDRIMKDQRSSTVGGK